MIATKESRAVKYKSARIVLVAIALFAAICIAAAVCAAVAVGVNAAQSSFTGSAEEQRTKIYDEIKGKAYAMAERANHTSNDAMVEIKLIEETSKLDVLKIGDTVYVVSNEKGKNQTCFEIGGTGIFSVDLSAAEFAVDSGRHHVLVRVPKPVMETGKISIDSVTQYTFEENPLTSNGSIGGGEALAQNVRIEAKSKIQRDFESDEQLYKYAEKRAEAIIRSNIIALNPDVSDITVDVEFYA